MADIEHLIDKSEPGAWENALRYVQFPVKGEEMKLWGKVVKFKGETQGEARLIADIESKGAWLTDLGGACPVQGYGHIGEMIFYFRARGTRWQFHVAATEDGLFENPSFYIDETYSIDPYAAGWMENEEALEFISRSIDEYLKGEEMKLSDKIEEASTGSRGP